MLIVSIRLYNHGDQLCRQSAPKLLYIGLNLIIPDCQRLTYSVESLQSLEKSSGVNAS